jgi:hypothetical protein
MSCIINSDTFSQRVVNKRCICNRNFYCVSFRKRDMNGICFCNLNMTVS